MTHAVIYKVRHGALCHLEGDQVIGAALQAYGEWAEEEIHLLGRVLQPGSVVLDVGANIGTHTLAFSRMVGQLGQVISFDGQRRAFTLLGCNMMINRVTNVQSHNMLVGAEAGIAIVEDRAPADPNNLGSMSFSAGLRTAGGAQQPRLAPVATITIDALRLSRCDLIKIDVEGMELEVLRGAVATLQRHNPVIYFEQTGQQNLEEICAVLRGLGYQLFWHVARPYNRANYRQNAANIFGSARETNIVGVHASRRDLAAALGTGSLPPVTTGFVDLASDCSGDWTLPEGAYSTLEIPFTHRVFGQTFDAVLPGSCRWVAGSSDELVRLSTDFQNLLEDRRKAQDIMEHLSNEVASLSRQLEGARQRALDTQGVAE